MTPIFCKSQKDCRPGKEARVQLTDHDCGWTLCAACKVMGFRHNIKYNDWRQRSMTQEDACLIALVCSEECTLYLQTCD